MTFIHDLFARCQTPAFITFSVIHPDGNLPTPSRHVRIGDELSLVRTLDLLTRANKAGWGAYMGMGTRQRDLGRWARGGKSELVELPAIYVDIDQPGFAKWNLFWFDIPASCIVQSGGGYHAYWFLDPPTTDFVTADEVLRGLAHRLGGDEVLSVAQSMRLPGSINTKPTRNFAQCSFIEYHPERLYTLEEFTRFIIPTWMLPHFRRDDGHWTAQHSDAATIHAVTTAVIQLLDGRWRQNGFIAARCPLPHQRDRPGMHFSYHPETGWGHCFGKHGAIPLSELCRLLGVPTENYQTKEAA